MIDPPKKFVSLHNHCGYSVGDGMGRPPAHIDYVISTGNDAWFLTDHGSMNGAAESWLYAKDLKSKGVDFRAVCGVEAYIHHDLDEWRRDFEKIKEEKKNAKKKKKKKIDEEETESIQPSDDSDDPEMRLSVESEERSRGKKSLLNVRHHLVLLPKTQVGLKNLYKLVSTSYRPENYYRYPRIDYKLLKAFGEDLIASTACASGEISHRLLDLFPDSTWDTVNHELLNDPTNMSRARDVVGNVVDRLSACVGVENVFLEIQFNKLPVQHFVNRAILDFSRSSGIPVIVTCDSHYPNPKLWRAREILKKLAWMKYEDIDPSSLPKSADELKCELYPKTADEVWREYKKTTEGMSFYDDEVVRDAIERTRDVAFEVVRDPFPDTRVKLPVKRVVSTDKTPFESLWEICKQSMVEHGFVDRPEYVERLKTELSVIKKKGYEPYFLLMRKIVEIADKMEVLLGCGRGSSAGSLVNYLIGATSVDPIEDDLMFERFLTIQRKDNPDIDTDVSDRDKMFLGLGEEFGVDNVLYVSNFMTMKLKSLVKDVSKFYGVPYDEVNAVTRIVEDVVRSKIVKQGDDKNLFELTYEDSVEHCKEFREFMESHPEVSEVVQQLHKEIRTISVHAGGIIILDDAMEEMPVVRVGGSCQTPWVEGLYTKTLERLGYCKMDVLGLSTLRVVQLCVEKVLEKELGRMPTFKEVKEWVKAHVSPTSLKKLDGSPMYKHVYEDGRFPCVFQFTSSGAQSFIQKFKPQSVTEIAAATSIYRPGPLVANVDKIYLEAKEHPDDVKYEHPLVEKVLKKTHSCIVFQEQAMQLCHYVGGFNMSETDDVRKALLKRVASAKDATAKKQEELGIKFVEGAVKNGLKREDAEGLWKRILAFLGYAFNACVTGDTIVNTYDRGTKCQQKQMKHVQIGDLVMSRDEKTKKNVLVRVKKVHHNGVKKVVRVTLKTGETVNCTMDHKFRTMDGQMLPLRQIIERDLSIMCAQRVENRS